MQHSAQQFPLQLTPQRAATTEAVAAETAVITAAADGAVAATYASEYIGG